MKQVTFTWDSSWHAGSEAIEMNRWCKDLGLNETQYDFEFIQSEHKTVFTFYDNAEEYATLFALRWGERA